jgi:xanthine dehydrogenase accessory factor
MMELYQALLAAGETGEPVALGIISSIRGSSPQKAGAKAIFHADGRMEGTLGGGCLEAEIRRRAGQALQDGRPQTFELLLDHDFGWDDGLICGGKVFGLILPAAARAEAVWREILRRDSCRTWGVDDEFAIDWIDQRPRRHWLFQETITPPCDLWIAGSGHVARAVAPLAIQLDFAVTIFDDRPALANPEFFPPPVRLRVDYWEKLLVEPPPSLPPFGLIVTRGHQHDALVLRHWIQMPFAFLGMIGSRRKKRVIFSHFIDEGIATEEQLQAVACPVGVNIGSVTVPEIAVSIVSQLIQARARCRRSAVQSEVAAHSDV